MQVSERIFIVTIVMQVATVGDRAFAVSVPRAWNSLQICDSYGPFLFLNVI